MLMYQFPFAILLFKTICLSNKEIAFFVVFFGNQIPALNGTNDSHSFRDKYVHFFNSNVT